MGRAFVFPGQGSQAVGMGKALNDAFTTARYFFEEVDEALGQHLSRLMFEGPEEQLRLTENAQPAIMAASSSLPGSIMIASRVFLDQIKVQLQAKLPMAKDSTTMPSFSMICILTPCLTDYPSNCQLKS